MREDSALISINAANSRRNTLAPMDASFLDLLAHCRVSDGARPGGLLAGLFLAGVTGSALHCAPMCGAFVLGQVSDRIANIPLSHFCQWRRVRAGALLPYHLGRITTYAALGALSGLSAGQLSRAPWLHELSSVLLTLAAGALLFQIFGRGLEAGGSWSRMLAGAARRLGGGGFGLGLVLGLLPCGLIYGALLAASSSASPSMGAAAMVAFGLGTAPALVLVGIAGQAAGHRWRLATQSARPVLVGAAAMLLLGLVWA